MLTDSEYPTITNHFSFAFITKNILDLLSFLSKLLDSIGSLVIIVIIVDSGYDNNYERKEENDKIEEEVKEYEKLKTKRKINK